MVDQSLGVEVVDRNRVEDSVGPATHALFVDHVGTNSDPRDDFGMESGKAVEDPRVVLMHLLAAAHENAAVGVLDDYRLGVTGNEGADVVRVVRAHLALD